MGKEQTEEGMGKRGGLLLTESASREGAFRSVLRSKPPGLTPSSAAPGLVPGPGGFQNVGLGRRTIKLRPLQPPPGVPTL